MGGNGGKWGCNWSPASGHGVGRDLGCLLSTQPSMGVSSPTGDSLLPAVDIGTQQQPRCDPFPCTICDDFDWGIFNPLICNKVFHGDC